MTDTPRLPTTLPRQHGLTLVELLVSMTIGLVLMLAVISAYIGASGASAMTQAQGRMNEDAQAALLILSQHVRMASYNPKQPRYAVTGPYVPASFPGFVDTARNPVYDANDWPIRGCDGTFSNITSAANVASLACGTTGSDSLVVRYEADANNTVRNSTLQATDCLGQQLPTATGTVNLWNTATSTVVSATATFSVAESRFYIATSGSSPNLYCKGNGGTTPQPLVENVEDMQITYGVAPSDATAALTVGGYLSASELESVVTAPAFANLQDRWSKVATVRICLVVRSEQALAPSADSARYNDCSGTTIAPTDLRLRRAYSTTIVLRNRVAT